MPGPVKTTTEVLTVLIASVCLQKYCCLSHLCSSLDLHSQLQNHWPKEPGEPMNDASALFALTEKYIF